MSSVAYLGNLYTCLSLSSQCVAGKGRTPLITGATTLKRDQINFFLGNNSGHMFASIVKPFDNYFNISKFFLRPPCLALGQMRYILQKQGDVQV